MRFSPKSISPAIKAILAVYLTAGFVFALAPENWFPSTYMLPLMSKLAFVSFVIIALPLFIFKPDNEEEKKALARFQAIIAFALLINGLGGLGLYKLYQYGFQYDKLTHYVTPFVLTFGFFDFTSKWRGWSNKKAAVFSMVLVFAGGIVWEFLEYYSDSILGTTLVGLGGSNGTVDTIWDVIWNTLGILSALVYVYFRERTPHAIAPEHELQKEVREERLKEQV